MGTEPAGSCTPIGSSITGGVAVTPVAPVAVVLVAEGAKVTEVTEGEVAADPYQKLQGTSASAAVAATDSAR
jgi:uncharacterized spore protein YtfJ